MQLHTTIPIPKVLAWSADARNPIRPEYVVMEDAHGMPLGSMVWDGTPAAHNAAD